MVGGLAGQVIPEAEVATRPAHQGALAGEEKPTDVIREQTLTEVAAVHVPETVAKDGRFPEGERCGNRASLSGC